MFDTIIHYINIASPYICGFWAVFYMILNHNLNKKYLLERFKIRDILKNDFNIDLDDILCKIDSED